MALSIAVRLRLGRYDAAALRQSVAEWPPHPARVFSALVASASEVADWSALRWLESAGEPEVWASPADTVRVAHAAGYVVTNAIKNGGSQTHPGRSNGHKQRTGALPSDDRFALVWPDAEPNDATLGRLVRLARRVPYVGRSTSSTELTVHPDVVDTRPSWTAYRPVPLATRGAVQLRVPYRGYVDALQAGYERGQRSWEFGRTIAYLAEPLDAPPPARPPSEQAVRGPYSDLLVWGIKLPSVPIAGDRVLAVTDALRRAVISRVPDPVPSLVSGHGADGRPHVAYLGLPHVDYAYADGHLLGVALAVPAELSGEHRRRLLRAVVGEGKRLSELRLPWRRALELDYRPERRKSRGLAAERWTGWTSGTRCWVTATPVMLDHHPRRRDDYADLVAKSLVTAGYPQPASVDIVPTSPVNGGVHRPRGHTIPDGYPRRPLVHCRVEFAGPVAGPVIAGSLRYLGVGLFAPERTSNGSGGGDDADLG